MADSFGEEKYERFVAKYLSIIMEHQGFDLRVPDLPAKYIAAEALETDQVYMIRKRVWERTHELLLLMGLRISASLFNLTLKVKEDWEDD